MTVSVLNGEALPIIKIVPKSGFYDYRSKYTPGQTEYILPAPLDAVLYTRLQDTSVAACRALSCSGAARVDIPHVYPPAYRDYATIVFTPDCIVEQADGTAITDLSGGGTWNGWTCEVGERWVMSGNVPEDLYEAFYYVEGNISLEGNPNGIWYGTFVAEADEGAFAELLLDLAQCGP